MAGHSKFANIKHRKAAQDKKKVKIFTKLIRDLMTAARSGGGDPSSNPLLRVALDKAKVANMTKDVIERAIKRGTGEIEGADYVERTYEGYAPGGVAVIVQTLTDNPTRTITTIRTAFTKNGGNVGTDGTVAWMFDKVGSIFYPYETASADDMMEAAIEAGASDVQSDEENGHQIYTSVEDYAEAHKALVEKYGEPEESELTYRPTQMQEVSDEDTLAKIEKMIDALEADDDVQTVTTNLA
ncbi:MAG: YebC/PmpR family DNA-binding transcriptional regulator [Alphaproteobacteria bacterium CG_4_10_14_0_8_um_filter_53_9]|nr:MAG: YebC/PmpR family DNA-binding transcriptional regulator [Alphaproteobacteria bacterium CG_4_10_14_0_8_um_filter_53_9]